MRPIKYKINQWLNKKIKKRSLPRVEDAVNNFLEYLRDEKSGSVRRTAYFDFRNWNESIGKWHKKIEFIGDNPNYSDKRKLIGEGQIRIEEIKLANLEMQIEKIVKLCLDMI